MNCNRDSRAIGWLGVFVLILSLAVPASAAWKEKVLYSFQGGTSDGSVPAGGVVFDKQGNLYGATQQGGGTNCSPMAACGILVYQLALPAKQGDPWTETVLYVFQGNTSGDGATPLGGLGDRGQRRQSLWHDGLWGHGGLACCRGILVRLWHGSTELSPRPRRVAPGPRPCCIASHRQTGLFALQGRFGVRQQQAICMAPPNFGGGYGHNVQWLLSVLAGRYSS